MDKYTKLAKIGQGSFGCAYLVTRKSDPTGKKFVVKEIRMDPRDQQSALREAKLLAALDHPNIIACRESFLLPPPTTPPALHGRAAKPSQQVLCIVTEYADGGDLRKKLEQQIASRARMPEHSVLDLFVQMCLALKHLHDRKIIHRDIKPENVFLMQSQVVKLGDFGVATVLSNTLACAETMTGTPYYTSPEICLGKRYNSKTDIWSLGCVLYELLTFAHAFNGRSQRQLFDNIVNASFAPIAAVLGSASGNSNFYSKRLVDLVGEMLRKNQRDRPSVNQIIKKPIIMERIQSFLSERAMADELNHTVLHGHHIFRKQQQQQQSDSSSKTPVSKPSAGLPLPPPPPQRVAPSPVQKSPPRANANAAYHVVRRAEAVLADRKKPSGNAKASPSPLKQVAAAPKKKIQAAPVASKSGSKAPSVLLKKSRSFKKVAAPSPSPSPLKRSPAVVDRKRAASKPGAAAATPPRYLSPTKALEQKNRLLLQKKRAIVERAKQDALRARLVPAAEVKSPAQVADRISAFNAQWQAQRQQLLYNLPVPPSSAVAGAPVAPGSAVLPPPPVSADALKRPSEYPKPVVTAPVSDQNQVFVPPAAPISIAKARSSGAAHVKAAAAKQRDAMRRDIQNRKQELLKRAAGAPSSAAARAAVAGGRAKGSAGNGASPLDDPIILVQNLPDYYQMMEPPSSANTTANRTVESSSSSGNVVSPPPAPVSTAAPALASDLNADDAEMFEDVPDEEEEEDVAPVNLEFERMVLQLKSVVEASDLDDDASDSDDDDEVIAQQPPRIPEDDDDGSLQTISSPPYDAVKVAPSSVLAVQLSVPTLEDPRFTKALRALLAVKENAGAHAILSTAAPDHQDALRWMHKYIAGVVATPTLGN